MKKSHIALILGAVLAVFLANVLVAVGIIAVLAAGLTAMDRTERLAQVDATDDQRVRLEWMAGEFPEEVWLEVDLKGRDQPRLVGPVVVTAGDHVIVEDQLSLRDNQTDVDTGTFTKWWSNSPSHAKGQIRLVKLGQHPPGTPMTLDLELERAPDTRVHELDVYVVGCDAWVCF